ncbi:hypothetical protein MTO96_048968 [Rhipicephalus appendiculatus]
MWTLDFSFRTGATHRDHKNETSIFSNKTAEEVAREIYQKQDEDDAFFVCDLRDITWKVELWHQCLPRVTPFFAIKACGDPVVLAELSARNVNFDCSNTTEIQTILEMGVDPDRIIYAQTVKSTSHMKFAAAHSVTLMTFDCVEELHKIEDKNASVDEARHILETARDLHCNVVGVCFHVGAVYQNPRIFARTIQMAKIVFDMATELGKPMTILNIGGGFPGGVRSICKFKQVCESVRRATDEYFPPSSGVEIIAEPGQFFVASAYHLAVRVVGKRRRDIVIDGVLQTHQDVFLNESRDNCVSRHLYQFSDVNIVPLKEPRERKRDVLTTLWGGTCNPLDVIDPRKMFFDVNVDEWLLMDNMGAYTLSFACGFNGTGFPIVHYIVPPAAVSSVSQLIERSALRSGYSQPEKALTFVAVVVDGAGRVVNSATVRTKDPIIGEQVAIALALTMDKIEVLYSDSSAALRAFATGSTWDLPMNIPDIFRRAIEKARIVFDIAADIGKPMTVLDLGGGFPGGLGSNYKIIQICEIIQRAIDEHFPTMSEVQIIAEPGQFFCTSAYSLVVRVVGKRRSDVLIDGVLHRHQDVFFNESKDNGISRYIYDFLDTRITPLEEPRERPMDVLTTLWGGTSNPYDIINSMKPFFDVEVDEWLVMDNMGAYSFSFVCGFNGTGFPAVHYIATPSTIDLVRRTVERSPIRSGYLQPQEALKICFVQTEMLPGGSSETFYFTRGTVHEAARDIVQKQKDDDAFFVCDVGDIIRKVELWRKCLPRVTPFYAIKTCADPVIIAVLASLGVNFDCSNTNEMRAILDMGVQPDRIIYAHTIKSKSHMKFAEEHGITVMTFDCIEELHKVKDKRARLLLRIKADDRGCKLSFQQKFGCYVDDARHILETAVQLNIKVVGVA